MAAFRSRAKPAVDRHEFDRIIEHYLPALIEAAPLEALRVVGDVLHEALVEGGYEPPHDGLELWHEQVEADPTYRGEMTVDLFVAARDAALRAARNAEGDLREVVTELQSRPWRCFLRLELFLLATDQDPPLDLVETRLSDPRIVADPFVEREFAFLAREQIARVDESVRRELIQRILRGPDIGRYVDAVTEHVGETPSEDDRARYAGEWILERLMPIRSHLRGPEIDAYDQLENRLGHPRDVTAAAPRSGGVWVGPTSPVGLDDLKEQGASATVGFLRDWEAPGDFHSPSPEGLARILGEAVALDPDGYLGVAEDLRGLDPTYVRATVSGLRDAVHGGTAINWHDALELCLWVVTQDRDGPLRVKSIRDADPSWGWTRTEIARLLERGLGNEPVSIPYELRNQVWAVLDPLLDDPDVGHIDGPGSDPYAASLNCVRGQAMHALVRYLIWCWTNEGEVPATDLGGGMEVAPEAERRLARHVNPEIDDALAVRAVLGRWLPWLIKIDAPWVTQRLDEFFPDESGGDKSLAVWETYLLWGGAYDNPFHVLRREYRRHLARLQDEDSGHWMGSGRQPHEAFAEHLMTFFLRGTLTFGEEDRLIERFFDDASDEVRASALEFLGRILRDQGPILHPEHLEHLRTLWDVRRARLESAMSEGRAELAAFGWWFGAAALDADWALEQLKFVLTAVGRVEPAFWVTERLGELVEARPREIVEILRLALARDGERFAGYTWRSDGVELLGRIAAGGDPEAAQSAQHLASALVSRGMIDYRPIAALEFGAGEGISS